MLDIVQFYSVLIT